MKSYRKPYRVKRKKPILRNRFFRLGILVLAVIGPIYYFFLFSNFFQIKNIIITGNSAVSEDNIKAFIPVKNIFLINADNIKKDILENFPQVAVIEISKALPSALNVAVEERLAKAVWCEAEKCFFVDDEAVIFGEADGNAGELIKITGAKEMLNKEKIAQILEIQGKLAHQLSVTTTQAIIVSNERLNIKTFEGWDIYFNSKGDLDWQLQELGLILEKQISQSKRMNLEYIDLRFSRVFYK